MPDLAAISARLANHLHTVGVAVGPDRAGRFAAGLQLVRPVTTEELYWLGRVTLAATPAEIATYDRVFADVFRGVSDVADARGDPNQPDIDSFDRGRSQPDIDESGTSGTGGEPRPSPVADGSDRNPNDDDQLTDAPTGAPASAEELLRRRDFADCTFEELVELRRIVARLEVIAPQRPSRRRRRHRSGDTIDRRATMRRARRTGGFPVVLSSRRVTERRRRVVLIADVSGSMEAYSRAYLYLLHGAVKALRAETFVFSTQLTQLTRSLRTNDPERALRDAVGHVDDWSGGTRIGEAIREFNDRFGRRGLARGAVVVIVSDGWESDDPAELGEQMARLSRLAHRIVWVNPRSQSDHYEPLVGGMAVALPHVDTFTSGHSLDALDDVLAAIADEPRRSADRHPAQRDGRLEIRLPAASLATSSVDIEMSARASERSPAIRTNLPPSDERSLVITSRPRRVLAPVPECTYRADRADGPRLVLRRAGSTGVDDVETFGRRTLGQPGLLGVRSEPLAHTLLERIGVAVLTDVAPQGTDLALDLLGDIDRTVGVVVVHDPDLVDRPGFETRDQELGERERVAGIGVDRRPHALTSGDMVGVAAVHTGQVDVR